MQPDTLDFLIANRWDRAVSYPSDKRNTVAYESDGAQCRVVLGADYWTLYRFEDSDVESEDGIRAVGRWEHVEEGETLAELEAALKGVRVTV